VLSTVARVQIAAADAAASTHSEHEQQHEPGAPQPARHATRRCSLELSVRRALDLVAQLRDLFGRDGICHGDSIPPRGVARDHPGRVIRGLGGR
jgi:hypothetical protein